MKSREYPLINLFIIACFSLLSSIAEGQTCKDSYNNALGYYQKGQFEYINDYLINCLNEFPGFKTDYLNNRNGKDLDLVFKVYKLIITSYKNIDRDNLASQKLHELVGYFHGNLNLTEEEVQKRLDNTSLDYIK